MGLSTDQGVNINMAQNVNENAKVSKQQKQRVDQDITRDNIASIVSEDHGESGIGVKLLGNLVKKASDADVNKMNQLIQKKSTEAFNREIDLLYKREEAGQDGSTVSHASDNAFSQNKNLKNLKDNLLSRNTYFSQLSEDKKTAMEDYVKAFHGAMSDGGTITPANREKVLQNMKKREEQLQKEGMDQSSLKAFKGDVKECLSYVGAEQQQKLKNLYEKGKHYFSSSINQKQKELLNEYLDAYPQLLLNEDKHVRQQKNEASLKEKLSDLEQKLEKAGFSKQEIAKARESMQSEFAVFQAKSKSEDKGADRDKPLFKGNSFFAKSLSGSQKGLIKEYLSCYPQLLLAQGKDMHETSRQQLQQRMSYLEQQLRREGMSSQQLHDLQMQIKYSVRSQLLSQIKDAYVQRMLIESSGSDKLFLTMAKRKEGFLQNYAFNQEKLGGDGFGGYRGGIRGSAEFVISDGQQDIQTFAQEEIVSTFVRANANPKNREMEYKNADKLIYLAALTGLNTGELMDKLHDVVNDLGLVNFKIEDYESAGGDSGQQQQKKPDYGEYAYNQDDEKEILINRYKALLMRRAVNPGARTYLDTAFKLMKTKKGLIQLGIFTPDLDEQMSEEATKMAVQKLLEMLKEALMERASFYALTGPAYDLNEKKIKAVLKNINRLDCPLSEEEFSSLKDQANKRMFDLANRELQMVNLLHENTRHVYYAQKRQSLVKLLERLKDESQIASEISYDGDSLSAMKFNDTSGGNDFSEYLWEDLTSKVSEGIFLFSHKDCYIPVVKVIIDMVENAGKQVEEETQKKVQEAAKYIKEMNEIKIEQDDSLKAWAREIKNIIIFIKRNKHDNLDLVEKLLGLVEGIMK